MDFIEDLRTRDLIWRWAGFSAIALLAVLLTACVEDATQTSPEDKSQQEGSQVAATAPTSVPTQPSPTPVPPTPTPTGPVTAFGDGMFLVGTDILPGTYIVPNVDDQCYWSRLASFSGELDDLIANSNPRGQSIVSIDSGDAGFESKRCGKWELLSDIATGQAANTFDDGTFAVGSQILPGTYRTDGTDRCYWERLGGFGGTLNDISANGNPRAQVIVEIAPTDVGFESKLCGTWTRIGD